MINGVVDNPRARRFELPVGDEIAAAYYRIDGDLVVLTHTEVPFQLSGRGVGTRLAEAVFEEISSSGRRAVVKCPFMSRFATRHAQYARLIAG
jgi:predicted GNAT family acetyltransferase